MTRPADGANTGGAITPALRRAATALWVAGIGLALTLVVVRVELARLGVDPIVTWMFIAIAAVSVIYGILGRLLVVRRPRQLVGWIFLATPVALDVVFAGWSIIEWANRTGNIDLPFVAFVGPIATAMYPIAILLAFPLLAIVFPDGRLPGPRWRWPVRIVVGAALLVSLATLFMGPKVDQSMPDNPLGIPALRDPLFIIQGVAMPIAIGGGVLLAVLAILVRVRRGTPDERRQLAWFLAAFLIVVVIVGPTFASDGPQSWINVLGVVSLALLPAATTLAILRYRLYEIDRIVSRTVAYAIVTAVLLAVFAAAVLGLQTVLNDLTGGDTVPVALSTLLVLSLFQPLRTRVQGAVDRRFHRARVDAARAIDAFGLRLRDETDLATVRSGTLETAHALMHPASAGLWLRAR